MSFCPGKGAKVGGAVGQTFLYIGSIDFFDILHEVRDIKAIGGVQGHFFMWSSHKRTQKN